MDLLPKQMCHRCSYKLEEFYNFYVECAKTDRELKSQLSWMSEENVEGNNSIPMVKMNKFKVKTEPLDNDSTDSNNTYGQFGGNPLFFPASILQHGPESNLTLPCLQCKCVCDRRIKLTKTSPKEIKASSKSESENKVDHSQILRNGPSVLIECMDVDCKIKCANKPFKDDECSKIDSQQQIVKSVDNEVFITVDGENDVFKLEKLNRALRPRKSLVDYIGPKKKTAVANLNLKTNVKNKLDYIDMSLVNPVDIRITKGNANHPSPIIKLEKVDDTIKSLRAQKNLELFNRRMKEFQRKTQLRKKENRPRNNLWSEVGEIRKHEKLKETSNSLNKKKSQNGENPARSLNREEHDIKCNIQKSEAIINGESSTDNRMCDSNNGLDILKSKIKQELVNRTIKSDKSSEHTVQDSTLKAENRLPFCAIVKLEKDYICNVDYPKVQIKRHLTMTNSAECQEGRSRSSTKEKDHSKITMSKTSPVKDESFLKSVRSNERRLKIRNNNHKTKSSKKNGRRLNFTIKSAVFDKGLSMVLHQSELKHCEKCHASFVNKELYKLHPCYQN